MDNLEYLEKVKKEDNKYKVSGLRDISDKCIEFRKMKALEIIAEELIGVKGELNLLASYIMAIKNLQ